MNDGANAREMRLLSAFATVARQWGATPLEGEVARGLGLDIEDSEIRLIYLLGSRTAELRPGDLAEQLGITRSALSKSLSRLRLAGLAESAVTASDRRSVFVTLTATGRDAYRQLVELGAAHVREASTGISPAELATISGFLERFAQRLGGPPPIVLPVDPE